MFEIYSEGKVFLDEIGKLSKDCQARPLRVLSSKDFRRVSGTETKTTNARIIVADSEDLEEAVKKETFSRELLGRLDALKIELPALRERLEDVPDLVNHFLSIHTPEGRKRKAISDSAMSIFKGYDWEKYNIRELENEIKRLIAMVDEDVVYPRHVRKEILNGLGNGFPHPRGVSKTGQP